MQTAGLKKSSAPGCRLSCWSLFVLLFLASTAGTRAQFVYTTNNDGTLNVAQYTDTNSVVVIPSSTNGMAVTSFGNNCFQGNTTITSITIPGSILTIGSAAFNNCSSLTNIFLGYGIKYISGLAFQNCTSLTSETIPDSVIVLGESAFAFCQNLASVNTGNGITNIEGGTFFLCTNLSTIILGTNVSFIGPGAFEASGLTNIILTENIKQIANEAFEGASLVKVVIPRCITILSNQFDDESTLKAVVIPSYVTNITYNALANCPNLSSVYFEGNAPVVNSSAFTGDNGFLTGFYLPGTTGWTNTSLPFYVAVWNPTIVIANTNFGVQNSQFGFDITNTYQYAFENMSIEIQSATNLTQPAWTQVFTGYIPRRGNSGLLHFTDYQWTNYPNRFYRISSP